MQLSFWPCEISENGGSFTVEWVSQSFLMMILYMQNLQMVQKVPSNAKAN